MIDLDKIATLLADKPHKNIYYGLKTDKIVADPMEIIGEEKPEDICNLAKTDEIWKLARKAFCANHKDIFPLAPSSYPNSKLKAILAKEGLERDWFYEVRLAMAGPITDFTKRFSIKETEATNPLYKQIKEQLSIYEKAHYEKKYSDMVLFKVLTDFELVPFSVLGNGGQTFGIGLYPGDSYGDVFWIIQNADALFLDKMTMNSLIHTLSFYFADEGHGPGESNPFGKSDHFTSLYISKGEAANCYLPKSVAVRALSYLEAVNKYLPVFHKEHANEIEDGHFYDVMLTPAGSTIIEKDIEASDEEMMPFADMRYTNFIDAPLKFDKGKTFSATFFTLPYPVKNHDDPDRLAYFSFCALLCDEKTGEVVAYGVGGGEGDNGLDGLVKALTESLEPLKIAKKIYVNGLIDDYFFELFFKPYIESKKVQLIPTDKSLKSDVARDAFIDGFDKFTGGHKKSSKS